MKTTILFVCIISGLFTFAQTHENRVFLFSSDSIVLKETDYGQYKKYEIINVSKATNKEIVKKSFIVYNDEIPEFKPKLLYSFEELQKDGMYDSVLYKTNLTHQAEIVYIRLRSMDVAKELNSETNHEPKAGTLLVATNVEVQKVDKKMKRQVKGILKEKMKRLRKKNECNIQPYQINQKWSLVKFSKNDPNTKEKYTEELFVDYQIKKERIEGKPISIEYHSRYKKRVKYRLVELITDSIVNKQQYNLEKLKKEFDSINTKINLDQDVVKRKADSISYLKKIEVDLKGKSNIIQNYIKEAAELEDKKQKHQITIKNKLAILPNIRSFENDFNRLNMNSNDSVSRASLFNYMHRISRSADTITKQIENKRLYVRQISIVIDSISNVLNQSNIIENSIKFERLKLQSDSSYFVYEINNKIAERKILNEILGEIESIIILRNSSRELVELEDEKKELTDSIKSNSVSQKILLADMKPIEDTVRLNNTKKPQYENSIKDLQSKLFYDEMKIDSVQIEFNDGSIENIQVIGNLKQSKQVLKFSNVGPIGFTSKTEIEDLDKRRLFANPGNNFIYSISAGQVIKDYYEKYAVDRRDYSPRNQITTISREKIKPQLQKQCLQNTTGTESINDSIFVKDVFKEFSSDILTGTVFTDLNGINGTEPNGIIQTEFYKEMAIVKRRYSLNRSLYNTKRVNLNVKTRRDFSFGYGSYIKPHFVISKIENENKNLELSYKPVTINNQTDSIFFSSTISFRKHETFRVGLNLNAFYLDFPSAKTTIFLDYSFYGALIPIIKPVSESQPAPQKFTSNAIEHGATIAAEFFTDERYGLRIAGGFNAYHVFNDQFAQVGDQREFMTNNEMEDETKGRSVYWKANFLAYLKPNSDGKGKIFFRYSYYMPHGHADLSWSQIQLGYAFSITKTEIPASMQSKRVD